MSGADILRYQGLVREVLIAPPVQDYAVRLVLATHPHDTTAPPSVQQYVRHGASPRGLQALVAGAQVRALLEDRFNVSRDDLLSVAGPALRHRLILNYEAQIKGVTSDSVVMDVMREVREVV
jgi:MoxR-like ATPase